MPSVKVRRVIRQEIDVPDLGARIKEARERSPKGVAALCRECNISRNYWYQLESEMTSGIAEDTLRKIEAALEVDFEVTFDHGGDRT